ncbi:unnamed protein product [Linum trigynum]|uniref:Uncharacterized protein n=1 Tax=Linum trigynum TaxID=586398 RepID=A0AAV2DUU5_9ROSI
MHSSLNHHWSEVKRILRYLRGTTDHRLFFNTQSSNQLSGYSDAAWANFVTDRRSTTGYVYLGSHLISWSSRKQRTVARSSTEAEYKALATLAAEIIWIESLLHEIGISLPFLTKLWCDNLGATYLSANPVFHSRNKHMEIDFHFVCERVVVGQLLVRYISTEDQLADLLTKPLPRQRFHHFKCKLKVIDPQLAGV